MLLKIEELKKFSVSEVCDLFGVESNDVSNGGVFKIYSENDRGGDGVISCEKVNDFSISNGEMNSEYDGVYSIFVSEDVGYDIVRVER